MVGSEFGELISPVVQQSAPEDDACCKPISFLVCAFLDPAVGYLLCLKAGHVIFFGGSIVLRVTL